VTADGEKSGAAGSDYGIVLWAPGAVRCGDRTVASRRLETPEPSGVWLGASGRAPSGTVRLTFAIDSTGRPLGIKREASAPADGSAYADSSDLEPALAASTFPTGAAQEGCQIAYAQKTVTPYQATPAQMVQALAGPSARMISGPVRKLLTEAGSTCMDAAPRPRVLYFPAFDTIPGEPGHRGTIAYRYDVDDDGVPTNVRQIHNAASDAAAAAAGEAIRKSRFAPHPKKGCLFITTHVSETLLQAPDMPPIEGLRPGDATCPSPLKDILHVGVVPFPEAFRRRSVLGWAIVRFDIAPWGDVGNVKALVAEPAAGFGTQAESVVRAAKADSSKTGYSGCVTRVMFKLDSDAPIGNFMN
jgi:outer membrane biosynthesis protein TonB